MVAYAHEREDIILSLFISLPLFHFLYLFFDISLLPSHSFPFSLSVALALILIQRINVRCTHRCVNSINLSFTYRGRSESEQSPATAVVRAPALCARNSNYIISQRDDIILAPALFVLITPRRHGFLEERRRLPEGSTRRSVGDLFFHAARPRKSDDEKKKYHVPIRRFNIVVLYYYLAR